MSTQPAVFDDRLDGDEAPTNEQEVLDVAERLSRERAIEDAPHEGKTMPVCSACVNETPMALSNASDVHSVSHIDRLSQATSRRLGEIGADFHDRYLIHGELVDTYIDAYYEACAAPEKCEICRFPDSYDECGHEMYGDVCPVRGEQ